MILLRSAFKVGLSLALALGLSACGSDKKEEDTSPCASANAIVADASYASLWANVFSGRCGTCHGVDSNTGTLGGPDMRTKETFYAQLVGKSISTYNEWDQAQITVKNCLTTPLINAGKSSESLVTAVLDPTILSNCGVKPHKDPPQSICISNGSLAALKKWIDNGAPN